MAVSRPSARHDDGSARRGKPARGSEGDGTGRPALGGDAGGHDHRARPSTRGESGRGGRVLSCWFGVGQSRLELSRGSLPFGGRLSPPPRHQHLGGGCAEGRAGGCTFAAVASRRADGGRGGGGGAKPNDGERRGRTRWG